MSVLLYWVWVVGFLASDSVSSIPLCLEVDCSSVPVVNLGGDRVHSVDSFHEGRW